MARLNLLSVAIVIFFVLISGLRHMTRERKKDAITQKGICNALLCFFLVVVLISLSGCDKTPDRPESEPELLVYCLNVSLVKGGTQTVTVRSHDRYGDPDVFTVSCRDPSVATVSMLDTILTVTGVNYGSTIITITSASGKIEELPVRIYDPQILDAGELQISYSRTFGYRWNDNGSGQSMHGSYWHPITNDGFRALGSLGIKNYDNPSGVRGVMVVKAESGSDALAAPVDYTLLFSDEGSNADDNGSFWIPVPPAGYKAMGIVAQAGYSKPGLDDVVCVREDLTLPGEAGDLIWKCMYLHAPYLKIFSSWKIEPPDAGPHENAYLAPGTFVAVSGTFSVPSVHPVMNVLDIPLPVLAETPYREYLPSLKGYERPPDETIPVFAREMLVPCSIVSDKTYKNDMMWRIANSPFYRFERQVFYKLIYHKYNQTDITQHDTYTREFGVSETKSDEFRDETSISITPETGITIAISGEKIAATVTKSFGYSSMTTVSELEPDEYVSGVDVPAGKAIAVWQRYNRFVLRRHNGTSLEPVKAWEFGIDSFVIGKYPD